MDNEIFEVSRDEYAGFLGQINPEAMKTETENLDDYTFIKTYSKNNGTHLCTRIISNDGEEMYYVFNLPTDDERVPPKKIAKIILNDRKEVEKFLKIISNLSNGGNE